MEAADFRKNFSLPSSGQGRETICLTYDFALDGGAVGVLDLLEVNDSRAQYIIGAHVKVRTAFAGGGASVQIGVKAGDVDAILPSTAVGSLTADSLIQGDAASEFLLLPVDTVLALEILAAPLTAGKLDVCLDMMAF